MDKVGAMVSGVDWNNLGGHGNAEIVRQIFIIIIILNKASISQTLSEHLLKCKRMAWPSHKH